MYTGSPWRPVTSQTAAYTAASAVVTNAFGNGVHVVRLVSTTNCFVAFGSAPTATTSDMYLPANQPEYFVVSQGQKVAAIQVDAGGNLHVTEMSR